MLIEDSSSESSSDGWRQYQLNLLEANDLTLEFARYLGDSGEIEPRVIGQMLRS